MSTQDTTIAPSSGRWWPSPFGKDDQHGMLEVASDLFPVLLDGFSEGQAIGQTGQAVAQHLGPQRPLGLNLDGPVDDAEQAARRGARPSGQRRELHPEIMARDAFAVFEIELSDDVDNVRLLAEHRQWR